MLEAAVLLAVLAILIAAAAVGYAWWVHGQMRVRTRALDEAQDRFEASLDARFLALQSEASRAKSDVRTLAEQVAALSARPTPTPPPASAPVASAATAAVATAQDGPRVIRARREETPPAAPAGPSLDELLSDYRAAAEDLAGQGDGFVERYGPVGVARTEGGDGYRAEGDVRSAFLWAVPHAGGWVLTPGYRALKDWRTHFAAQREHNGEAYFGGAFRLDGSGGRFDVEPAALRRDGDRFVVVRPGTIAGFRG